MEKLINMKNDNNSGRRSFMKMLTGACAALGLTSIIRLPAKGGDIITDNSKPRININSSAVKRNKKG